jgi:hypothetical protein
MFCPKCGKSDQNAETFCRQCGTFLPDFDKVKPREITPEEHVKANLALNVMTALASITLSILLFSFFFGKDDTPVIIYITTGFLTAMFAWQAQVFWRNLKLRKHFKNRNSKKLVLPAAQPEFSAKPTIELLPEADFADQVPASVVERTTRKLKVNR